MGMQNYKRNPNKAKTRKNKTRKRVAALRHDTIVRNNKLSFETYLNHKRFEEKPNHKLTAEEFCKRFNCEDHTFILDKWGLLTNSKDEPIILITDSMWNQFKALKRAKTG